MLAREEAVKLVERDNQPRWDSIRWYCETIGVDFSETRRIIDAAPRRYGVDGAVSPATRRPVSHGGASA